MSVHNTEIINSFSRLTLTPFQVPFASATYSDESISSQADWIGSIYQELSR